MSISKDDILNAVAEMSVMDVVALIEAMEEKFGVSAAAAVAAAGAPAGHSAPGINPVNILALVLANCTRAGATQSSDYPGPPPPGNGLFAMTPCVSYTLAVAYTLASSLHPGKQPTPWLSIAQRAGLTFGHIHPPMASLQ